MATFKTDRPNNTGTIFKDWLITVAILSLLLIFGYLFPGMLFATKASSFYVVGAVLLASLMEGIDKDRLYEIRFDNAKQQIVFLYKSLFSGSHQKILSFYDARLEVSEGKFRWRRNLGALTLSFLKGKREIFMINKSKDGFSIDTLHKICQTVENISLPVFKV
ncbi:MAG TPA: hypothetical protein VF939_04880 [Puia sp.]